MVQLFTSLPDDINAFLSSTTWYIYVADGRLPSPILLEETNGKLGLPGANRIRYAAFTATGSGVLPLRLVGSTTLGRCAARMRFVTFCVMVLGWPLDADRIAFT